MQSTLSYKIALEDLANGAATQINTSLTEAVPRQQQKHQRLHSMMKRLLLENEDMRAKNLEQQEQLLATNLSLNGLSATTGTMKTQNNQQLQQQQQQIINTVSSATGGLLDYHASQQQPLESTQSAVHCPQQSDEIVSFLRERNKALENELLQVNRAKQQLTIAYEHQISAMLEQQRVFGERARVAEAHSAQTDSLLAEAQQCLQIFESQKCDTQANMCEVQASLVEFSNVLVAASIKSTTLKQLLEEDLYAFAEHCLTEQIDGMQISGVCAWTLALIAQCLRFVAHCANAAEVAQNYEQEIAFLKNQNSQLAEEFELLRGKSNAVTAQLEEQSSAHQREIAHYTLIERELHDLRFSVQEKEKQLLQLKEDYYCNPKIAPQLLSTPLSSQANSRVEEQLQKANNSDHHQQLVVFFKIIDKNLSKNEQLTIQQFWIKAEQLLSLYQDFKQFSREHDQKNIAYETLLAQQSLLPQEIIEMRMNLLRSQNALQNCRNHLQRSCQATGIDFQNLSELS